MPLADLPALELASSAMPLDALAEPEGTVLYIEDNPVNFLLVQQLLARWGGVRLLHAESGTEGLRLVEEERVDLLLLDMQLPDMDGIAVLGRLRDVPVASRPPVVVLSASAMEDDVQRARESGAVDYWTKPLDFHQFLEGVRGHLVSTRRSGVVRLAAG